MPTLEMFRPDGLTPAIKMSINGEWLYFIVDTGAQFSLVAPRLADGYKGKAILGECRGAGGTEQMLRIKKPFRLLGKQLNAYNVCLLVTRLEQDNNYKCGGIIGQDILSQFSEVIFDYKKRQVRFVE